VSVNYLGVGLGYRRELQVALESHTGEVDFLEVIGDECFEDTACEALDLWATRMPIVCHFLGLSLGTAEAIDEAYLTRVRTVIARLRPVWISDHLAMTRVQGVDLGHLSPIAFSEESVALIARKAADVQARCGLPLLLENISYDFSLPGGSMKEVEALTRVVQASDCRILLDLTNLHVNSQNHGYDPYAYLDELPLERVSQIHIGGAVLRGSSWVDSHAHEVPMPVFDYLDYTCARSTVSSILLERDRAIPDFSELAAEMSRARDILRAYRNCPLAG
jgi:uncharacterized protein